MATTNGSAEAENGIGLENGSTTTRSKKHRSKLLNGKSPALTIDGQTVDGRTELARHFSCLHEDYMAMLGPNPSAAQRDLVRAAAQMMTEIDSHFSQIMHSAESGDDEPFSATAQKVNLDRVRALISAFKALGFVNSRQAKPGGAVDPHAAALRSLDAS